MRLNTAWFIAAFAVCFTTASFSSAQTAKATAATGTAAKASTATATDAKATAGAAGGAATPAPAAAPAAATPAATSAAGGAATATAGAAAPATAAAPAASTTAAPAAAAAAGAGLDGSTYVVRLRDLEQRIDELKEQIRRSHTRLSLLSDTILSGGVGGARAEISFRNDISNAFRLAGAVFVLDGVVQYNKQDDSESGLLASQKEIPIFSGAIPPGDHTMQVALKLHGYGYGVFSYLRSYKFEVKSSHAFTITEGKTVSLEVVAWEKGDVTTPLEQRPAIRFTENLKTGASGEGAAAPGKTAPAASPVQGSAAGGVSVGTGGK
jgi:hypothetical protein